MSLAAKTAAASSVIAVNKDTHNQIGRFAFVHSLYQEQILLLNAAKKELQSVNDAEEELILIDDEENIPCQVDNSSFFERTKIDAEVFLTEEKSRLQKLIDGYDSKAAEHLKEIEGLRRDLYGKLGNLVQLDNTGTEDDD